MEDFDLENVRKYERAVKGLNCGNLVWVFPSSASSEKTVFRAEPTTIGGAMLTSMQEGRDGFEASEQYVRTKLLRFSPVDIVKYNLQGMFSKPMRIKYKLHRHGAAYEYNRREDVKPKYEKESTYIKPKQETKKMSKTSQVITTVKDANVEAAKVTAKIAAGKALNTAVQSKIVPKLPMMVRGYAQTDVGKIVLANAVATALTYYAPNDAKAKMVSEAMIQSAMIDLMASFDVEGLVKEFLSSDAAERIVNISE